MYKTCPRCGTMHDINYKCYRNMNNKKETEANKIRKTNRWHKKSNETRERDNYLCQVCIRNLYETTRIYNYNLLEVHHIIPLEEDITKAFDDDNLISLCKWHHVLAEDNQIPRKVLKMIVNKEKTDEIVSFINKNTPPYL